MSDSSFAADRETTTALAERTAELQAANEQLQMIYDRMIEGLVITDVETKRFVRVNASFCRMLGYSEEEVLGASVTDIHPPGEALNDLERFDAAAKGFVSINEDRPVLRKDGSIFSADITGRRIFYEGRLCLLALFRDVTERKRAEAALRASEERFRSYFAQGLVGMAVTGVDKQWREVNDRLCEILGYSRDEFLAMKWTDATHPDDVEAGVTEFNRLVAGEIDHFTQDKRFIRKNGDQVYATVFIRCFRRADGSIDHFLALIEDATQRKQAEMALRESEERYRAVVEDQTEIICRFEADGTLTFVSDVFCRFFGKKSEDLVGSKWQPGAVAEDVPMIEEQLRTMSPDNPIVVIENRVRSGRGEIHWMQFVNRGFFDPRGRVTEVQAVGRDVTVRKRFADALRQSHDELRVIYDHIVDGVTIVDAASMKPIRVNSAYCRMLGYCEDEAYFLFPERAHPPHVLPRVWEHLDEVKRGKGARIEDLPFLHRDGTIVYADVVSRSIDYNDRPGWISFFHDVTERKLAKEALAREHRTLKHLLQSSDHERQLIAYEIHDGLAQQLAGAIMQFDTYAHQKDREPRLAADAFEAGMTMLRQSHFEARRLISGVRPPILDEAGIVAAVAHLVNEERHKKGPKIELLSKVEFERLAPVLENAMYRIVQEALNNACRHSESERVEVGLVQHGDKVRIEVRDQGVGFRPEDVGDSHFGVAGIRERARLLGGIVAIESEPGQGTRIAVELPIVLRSEEDDETPGQEK